MSDFLQQHYSINSFKNSDNWVLLNRIESSIKEKIEKYGIPLSKWNVSINYGIKTGYNDAFIIDEATKNTLITSDPKSAELIRPLKSDYDLIIIDTVPTPSVYTNNAIVASDYVMIPLQAEEESTNNIQNYISYLIDLQEQFNPGLDMIGFVPYLVDTDSATIKSNLEELYKQHKEDNLVFQNIIKRSNKVSTWSKNGITEHKGYDKKVLSMYENVFFEMLERIIQLENEKE